MPVFLVLCSAELGKFNSLRPLWRIFCNFSCLVAWSWPLLFLSFSDIRLNFCGMPDFFLLSFRWLSFCIIVFTLVLPTLLVDLFLLYRSLYYARSFGFAFVGFIHMFILFLRVFFSFLPGIAAVLGFTSICISKQKHSDGGLFDWHLSLFNTRSIELFF